MTDTEKLTDRELLIRIHTIVELQAPRILALEQDVTALKLAQARNGGMVAGAKALWAVLGALPASLAVYLLGNK